MFFSPSTHIILPALALWYIYWTKFISFFSIHILHIHICDNSAQSDTDARLHNKLHNNFDLCLFGCKKRASKNGIIHFLEKISYLCILSRDTFIIYISWFSLFFAFLFLSVGTCVFMFLLILLAVVVVFFCLFYLIVLER